MIGHIRLTEKQFERLGTYIHANYGIKMPPVKKIMLEGRLQKRLRQLGMTSFDEYIKFVFSPEGIKDEMVNMIDMVTTNKTDFFREPQHFQILAKSVLPELEKAFHAGTRRPLKIWSAGCSTGEEPYTLAIVLSEYAAANPGFNFEITATDISSRVLDHAATAVYKEDKIVPIEMALRKKYLLRSKDRTRNEVRIVSELRKKVRFKRLNFMDDAFDIDFTADIIFCRNVIIYFDRPTQEVLLNKFCLHLRKGGYIFMGHSETLNGLAVPLKPVAPTVYTHV